MKKEIIVTTDGSHSIAIPEMGVTYHSIHGAIRESDHVFIKSGLLYTIVKINMHGSLSVFEMGFGTGLNALLTLLTAEKMKQVVYYETIELHPLEASTFGCLNYCEQLQRSDLEYIFAQMHHCAWNEVIELSPYFWFKKINTSLADYTPVTSFDIIYFDAFAPDIQPDVWTAAVFKNLYEQVRPGGVLTTYCSKSIVRRAMAEAGWKWEKIPGPPHKREMVRATKPAR